MTENWEETTVSPRAENYLALAYRAASKFVSKNVKDSEEYSQACLLLVQAVEGYRPEQGNFLSYARRTIHNGLITAFRHDHRKKRVGHIDHDADLNYIANPETEWTHYPTELLYELLKDTPEETSEQRADKLLLIEVYLGGQKVIDIARRLKVSRERIYQRMRASILRIRQKYADLLYSYENSSIITE